MSEDDNLLSRIREHEQSEREDDAKLERVAAGTATGEELAELEARAANDPAFAAALEASRPLDREAAARIAAALPAAEHAPAKKPASVIPFSKRLQRLATPLALAAGVLLFVFIRRQAGTDDGGTELPAYAMNATSTKLLRGPSDAPAEGPNGGMRLRVPPGANFELDVRPATAVPARVVAFAFTYPELASVDAKIEVAEGGAVRITGPARALTGAKEVRVVIGTPETIASYDAALARATDMKSDAHVRVLAVPVDPAGASSPSSPATNGAPITRLGAPGPIVVKGYPAPVRNGMNDPASHAGFTKDGTLYGYCADGGGLPSTTCRFVDRTGAVAKEMHSSQGDEVPAEVEKKKQIDRFIADNGIVALVDKPGGAAGENGVPPPVRGTWRFTDITIEVASVEGSDPSAKGTPAPAVLKVGGSVSGEPPVFPITLADPPIPGKTPVVPYFAALNNLAISPDGTEIGMLGHFFACEFCNFFQLKRMPLASFASLVYNDTGYRHHQAKEFARAAQLFASAVLADTKAKLPAYNLACAYAQLGDAHTKEALEHAIELDPSAKARAAKDKDFDKVRGESWFATATK